MNAASTRGGAAGQRLAQGRFVTFGVIVLMSLVILLTPTVATACSQSAPYPLTSVVGDSDDAPGGPITGVYERRHIAWVPPIPGLRTARSASVVTKYWGDPPDLAVRVHGDAIMVLLGGSECGNSASRYGEEDFEFITERDGPEPRYGFWIDLEDRSTEQAEADLTAAFGPPTEVSAGIDDYAVAYAAMTWRPLLSLAILGLLVVASRRAWADRKQRRFNPWIAGAALIGVPMAAYFAPHLSTGHLVGALITLGLAAGLGWLSQTVTGLITAALAIHAALWVFFTFSPRGMDRGITLAIFAAAVLMWAQRGRAWWAAAVSLPIGAATFTGAWLREAGYVSELKMTVVAAVVGAATFAYVWWARPAPIGTKEETAETIAA